MTSNLRDPADFRQMIAQAERLCFDHLIEMLRPAMQGDLNVIVPTRDMTMPPLHRIGRTGRPLIVLVGDDG